MQAKNNLFKPLCKLFKYIIYCLNFIVLALLLCSYFVWNIPPSKNIYLAYFGLGFIFVLIAIILFLFVWLFSRNWLLVAINILVILICIPPIKVYVPLTFSDNTPGQDKIKILSYNVRGFNWKIDKDWESNPIFTYLKESDADIICIQEYLASESQLKATSEKLRKALGYPYAAITPLRPIGGNVYGLACFSKYPILNVEKLPLVSDDNGSVLYKIDINGKSISLFNNHLESNKLTSKDKALYATFFKEPNKEALSEVKNNMNDKLGKAFKKRAPQAEMLSKYISEQTSDGIIVCGDFNDTPMSYTYHQISKDLDDAYLENGFGPGITYHENHFLFRIDFILHSKNMKSANFRVDKVTYSDHYPISTYLSFKE